MYKMGQKVELGMLLVEELVGVMILVFQEICGHRVGMGPIDWSCIKQIS